MPAIGGLSNRARALAQCTAWARMPSSKHLYLLDNLLTVYTTLTAKHGHKNWYGEWKLRATIIVLYADSLVHVRSPRTGYFASDFAGKSFWKCLRDSLYRRDGALMQFLGVPWFLFNQLVTAMEVKLGPHSALVSKGSGKAPRGRPPAFDAMDITALALRRYQTQGGQEILQIDFGMPRSVISRYLSRALHIFDSVIAVFPGAEIRYPTLAEAEAMWAGVVTQFGGPPCALESLIALTIDGTLTPVLKNGDPEVQTLYYSGKKGDGTNNVLVKDMWGAVCDYVLGAPGACHDMGISKAIFERHASVETNPHRLAMLADSGFVGAATNGTEGGAAVYRPLKSENVETAHLPAFTSWSKWVTSVRQVDEWGQAAIKRSFPYFCNPVRVQDIKEHIQHQRAILHLYNLRTRVVGYNQLTTTLRRHTDANFSQQLAVGRGGEAGLQRYMAIAEARYSAGEHKYGV